MSLTIARRTLVRFDTTFEPNAVHRAYYDDRFDRYRQLYEALKPLNAG